ncbi:hypothetical protein PLICRDRAFT_51065 [Plicaturopsis crispa FD-325 SS-3]|nr:hypothetical protein PLICRDRAFT_51065 [Plicaturopsis crispa FD-325 SS-3]
MSPTTNQRLIYNNHPEGNIIPGETTKLVRDTIDLDTIPLHGGFLVKTLALSSDPYVRGRMRPADVESYAPPLLLGKPVANFGVGKVIRSEDKDYNVGDYVYGFASFEEYIVTNATSSTMGVHWTKLQRRKDIPWSLYTGVLGMPGQTSYFGWRLYVDEKAKTSKTFFISGGAGPVGTFVIQYAKIRAPHLKIIASAGSAEKVALMKAAGADVAFNYKTEITRDVLKTNGPIDIYWDNVAGSTLDDAIANMSQHGLVIACGSISGYNGEPVPVKEFGQVFGRELTVKGLLWGSHLDLLDDFHSEVPPLVEQGKITTKEHRFLGIEKAEEALQSVQTGANTGKAVIIVAED